MESSFLNKTCSKLQQPHSDELGTTALDTPGPETVSQTWSGWKANYPLCLSVTASVPVKEFERGRFVLSVSCILSIRTSTHLETALRLGLLAVLLGRPLFWYHTGA